jgi:hypothetical protein
VQKKAHGDDAKVRAKFSTLRGSEILAEQLQADIEQL